MSERSSAGNQRRTVPIWLALFMTVTLAALAAGVSSRAVEKTGVETRFTTSAASSAFDLTTEPGGFVFIFR